MGLATALAAAAAVLPDVGRAQPVYWDPATGGNGHYYEIVEVPGGLNWWEARLLAAQRGGTLATIQSAAENAWVHGLALARTNAWIVDPFNNTFGPHLGGIQPDGSVEPAGGWQWVTGEPFTFAPWAPNEPNNSGGAENYLHYLGVGPTNRASTWNDLAANNGTPRSYALEIDLTAAAGRVERVVGADFSADQNPALPWSYGWSAGPGAPFIPFTKLGTDSGLQRWQRETGTEPAAIYNPSGAEIAAATARFAAGRFHLHPGPSGEAAIVRFTCPVTGVYEVLADIEGADTVGTSTDVRLEAGTNRWFQAAINGFGPASRRSYRTAVALTAGTTIDVAVGPAGSYLYDSTRVDLRIFYRRTFDGVAGEIAYAGDEDTYTFRLEAPTTFCFDSLTANSSLTWSLSGPPGTVVSQRTFTSSDSDSVGDPLLRLPAGDYTLTVQGVGAATGAYQFRLLDLADAALITPGATVASNEQERRSTALYQFTGTAGDILNFDRLTLQNGSAPYWRLVDPYGRILFETYFNDVNNVVLPATGSYTLLVEGTIAGGTGTAWSFRLVPNGSSPPAPFTGTPLVFGTTISNVLAAAGATNDYVFSLAQPTWVVFDSLIYQPNLRYTLLGPGGVMASTRALNGGATSGLHILPAGDYLLRITAVSGYTGPFVFRPYDLATSRVITPGTVVQATNVPANGFTPFRFNATAGTRLFFDAISQSGHSYWGNCFWTLVDPYGNFLFADAGLSDRGPLTLTGNGTYTLWVAGGDQEPGPAGQFSFNVVPGTETATALALNTEYRGAVATPSQRHFFTFTLTSPKRVYFQSLTNVAAVRWSLTGPAGVVQSPLAFSSGGWLGYTLQPGDYTLTVDGAGENTGGYHFQLTDFATGAANPVTVGATINGTLAPARQVVIRDLPLTAGDRLYFDTLSQSGFAYWGNLFWKLEDPEGNTVYLPDVNVSFDRSFGDVGPFLVPRTATYRLLLGGGMQEPGASGNYSFRILPADSTTEPLVLGQTYETPITSPGQERVYTFTLPATTRVTIDNLRSVPGLRWTLTGEDRVVGANVAFNTDGWQIHELTAGTYRFTVSASADATGAALFRITPLESAVAFSFDTTITVTNTPPQENRVFRFAGTAGQRLYFDVLSQSGFTYWGAPFWILISPNGNTVFDVGAADRGPLVLAESGNYTMILAGGLLEPQSAGVTSFRIITSPVNTTPLVFDALVAGTLDVPGEIDRYTFTLAVPTSLLLDSRTNSPLRTSISGPGGSVYANRTFTSSDGLNLDGHVLLPPGSYTLDVTGNGDDTGGYAFLVRTFPSAEPLTLNTTINATLAPANSTRLYRFDAAAGDRVRFQALAQSGVPNLIWRLRDPAGDLVWSTYFSGTVLSNLLARTGTYTLQVEGYLLDPGNGTFSFSSTTFPSIPPSPLSGTPLALGQVATNVLPAASAVHSWLIELSQPGRVYLDFLLSMDGFSWALIGTNGPVIPQRSITSGLVPPLAARVLPAGTYEFRITGATTPYAFRILDVEAAPFFTPGGNRTNLLVPSSGAAIFRVQLTAGTPYYFDDIAEAGFSGSPDKVLLTPYGNAIFAYSGFSDSGTFRPAQSGEHVLIFDGPWGSPGATGSIAHAFAPVALPTNALVFGTIYSGTLSGGGSLDSYTFNLTETNRVFFDAINTPTVNWSWSLTGPAGTRVDSRSALSSDGPDFADASLVLIPGSYVLRIEPPGPQATPYAFRLLRAADATPIAIDEVVGTNFAPASASALFRFAGTAGQLLYYDALAQTGFQQTPTIRLYTPAGTRLQSQGFSTDLDTFTLPTTGEYLVAIEGRIFDSSGGGSNRFVYRSVTHVTNVLTPDQLAAGTISVPGTRHYWTFSLPAATRLWFDALTNASGATWTLRRGTVTLVSDRSFLSSDSIDFGDSQLNLPAADYVLTVELGLNNVGSYAFQLVSPASATVFVPGAVVPVVFDPVPETRLYSFTGTAGSRFYFDALGISGSGSIPSARLYTPAGAILFNTTFSGDVSSFALPFTGTYLLSLEGRLYDSGSPRTGSFLFVPNPPKSVDPLFEETSLPDLTVPTLAVTPSSGLRSGDRVTVNWTVRNDGALATGGSFTDRVLIRNTTLNQILVNTTLPYDPTTPGNGPIGPGAQRTRSLQVTLPEGAPGAGALEVVVTTDALNQIPEANTDGLGEANNARTAAFTSALAPYPDLQVTGFSANPAPGWPAGTSIQLTWAITNTGPVAASTSWVDRVIVRNTSRSLVLFTTNVAHVGDVNADGPLLSGAARARVTTFTVPAGLNGQGDFEISVETDAVGQVVEAQPDGTGETNNLAILRLRSAPNLQISGLAVTATPAAQSGAELQVSWTLDNTGNAPVDSGFSDRIIVRHTGSGAVLVNTTTGYNPAPNAAGPIAPGASRNRSASVRLPDGPAAAGPLEIEVTTDTFNQVFELTAVGAGEADNTTTNALTTTIAPYPDLRTAAVTVTPGTPLSGQEITVRWEDRNDGSAPVTAGWYDRVQVVNATTAATVVEATVFHNTGSLGPIPPGGTRIRQQLLRLPNGLAGAGSLRALVTADTQNSIFEYTASGQAESNNTASVDFTATLAEYPDLAIHAFSVAPSTAPAIESGASLTLTWVLTNTGPAAVSGDFYDRLLVRNLSLSSTLLDQSYYLNPLADTNGPIAPATSRLRTATFRLPDGAAGAGSIEFALFVDSGNRVFEFRDGIGPDAESNNATNLVRTSTLALYPDLAVTGVAAPANGLPGQPLDVSWTVTNTGVAPTPAAWTDQVFLVDDANPAAAQLVGTFAFNAVLAPGGTSNLTRSVTLPFFTVGTRRVAVRVNSGPAFYEPGLANNYASAAASLQLAPRLDLVLNRASIPESGSSNTVTLTVIRNGSTAADLTVALTNSEPGSLQLPGTVVVPAGRSQVTLAAVLLENAIVDGDRNAHLDAAAPGYSGASADLLILDNDTPLLAFQTSAATVDEDGGASALMGYLTRNANTNGPLVVTLTSDAPGRLSPPASVTIAAGSRSVAFPIAAPVNTTIEGDALVRLQASAPGYAIASAPVTVRDNDLPPLTLTLAATAISEGAESPATTAVLSRPVPQDFSLPVALNQSIAGLLLIPPQVTIPAGATAVTFNVNVTDDNLVTGTRQVQLFARTYVAGAPLTNNQGLATLTVYDNDGPTLSLDLASEVVNENGSVQGTVRRNTSTASALTVTLSSSDSGEAVPAGPTVVIAAGQTAANFTINGVPDGQNDGIQQVLITAAAAGFNSANARLNVSDIDLPDLAVGDIIVPSSGQIDARANVTYTVSNTGPVPANGPWVDRIFISTDNQLGGDILAGSITNTAPLGAASAYTRTVSVTLPSDPARYHIIVITDADSGVTEGNERNNVISIATIDVQPTYRATVETDITAAPCGTAIPIRGRAFNPEDNSPARLKAVTVRVLKSGSRRVYTALTDLEGQFRLTFTPLPTETGDYQLAADHPRVAQDVAQDSFALLGLGAGAEAANMTVVPGEPITGSIAIQNLTSTPLSGITAVAPDAPASLGLQLSIPPTLGGRGVSSLEWSITTTITNAARVVFPVILSSAEGCTNRILFTVNVAPLRPQLIAEPAFLERGMVRGVQTLVSFAVRNIGGVATGPLDLLPPDLAWLRIAGSNTLESLEPGAATTVNVLLNPPADLPLSIHSGTIAVGNGRVALAVPFRLRAVSTAVGDLRITATDDYTYYVAGSPKLTNALVTVTDPFGGGVVTNGVTDASGEVVFRNLPEGAYTVQVTAAKHNTYRGTAMILPGAETAQEAFLSRQTVSYRWSVVPIEVQDRYRVVLESVFETEVPIPNVIVEEPYIMPLVIQGETNQFEIGLRNEGLIAAENVEIIVPNHPDYIIEPIVRKIGTIPAKSRLVVPVLIRQRNGSLSAAAQNAGAEPGFQLAGGGSCELGVAPCLPKIPLGVNYYYVCGPNGVLQQRSVDLSPVCIAQSARDCIQNTLTAAGSLHEFRGGGNAATFACDLLAAVLQCAGVELSPCQSAALSIACGAATGGIAGAAGGAASGSTLECICGFIQNLNLSLPPSQPQYGEVNYVNGSILGTLRGGYNGYPGSSTTVFGAGSCSSPSASASLAGSPLFSPAGAGATPGGVCARVRIQIDQEAVLTRVAFRGSLEIENDSATPITGLRVTLDFRDASGRPAGDRFVIRPPLLSGLGAVDGTGGVGAFGSGSAEYLFLPTRDAAPDAPVVYRIGGSLRYIENGQEVVVPLVSTPITVYPEARLQLHYFQSRNVYADDPFTDAVEPSEPFSLGLLARNVGAGEARNFRITSAQPKIIENQKGLLIDFKIIGSQVGSTPAEPSLTVNLGHIPAGRSQVAQWLLTSSLQGKFIEYKATFEHIDNFGSTNLSLIDSVQIHELIAAVRASRPTDDAAPDFLVNEVPDADSLPDLLYLSDGTTALVEPRTAGSFSNPIGAGGRQTTLTAAVPAGWVYLRLPDPGPGWRLHRVVRSDNKEIAVGTNAWTTDRSFPSAITGVRRETLFHLFDYNSTGSYTLYYRPDDRVPPSLVSVGPVTPAFQTASLNSVTVEFSEEMEPSTFTAADVSLSLNGGPNRLGAGVFITRLATNRFSIDGLAAFTADDGNYTLTVNAAGMEDTGGNVGTESRSTSWAKGTIAPVVTALGPVVPNPRNTPVAGLEIVFSRAIDEATFTPDDLVLTRDGGANLISSAVLVQPLDTNRFLISGLGALTQSAGAYRLTVAAAGVQDTAGHVGAGIGVATWSMVTEGPAIASLEQPATNPRNIVVASLDVTFAAPIEAASFTWQDLALTRDGGPNLITSAVTIQPVSPILYRVANFNWASGNEGHYTFSVSAAGIVDPAGNPGSGSASAQWTMDTTRPGAPTAPTLVPDPGISATDGLINTLTPEIRGTLAESNLTVRVKDLTTGVDYGPATVTGTTFRKALALGTAGAHQLELRSVDAAGNTSFPDTRFEAFVDLGRPSATIDPVTPALRNAAVDSLTVTFSEAVNPATFHPGALSLRRQSGGNLINAGVAIVNVSSNVYRVTGLAPLTDTAGAYAFSLDMALVEDRAGNTGTNTVTVTWSRTGANRPPTLQPIADRFARVGSAIVITNVAADPDAGQTLRFSLNPDAPANARLGEATGVFRWTPTRSQSPGLYPITVTVTDDGVPPASASRTFLVGVEEYTETSLGEAILLAGEPGGVDVALISTAGLTNLQAEFSIPTNGLTGLQLAGLSPLVSGGSLLELGPGRYRVALGSQPGQSIRGSNVLARLTFGTVPTQPSAFLPLPVGNITARQPDGTAVGTTFTRDGRVVLIADRPLLEITREGGDSRLRLFARPGDTHDLQSAVSPAGPWTNLTRLRFTGRELGHDLPDQPSSDAFFRLLGVDVSAPFFEILEADRTGMDVIFYGPRGRSFDLETGSALGAPWSLLRTQPMTNTFQELRLDVPAGENRFLRARER